MIPSRELEEKRKAYVRPEANYTTKIGKAIHIRLTLNALDLKGVPFVLQVTAVVVIGKFMSAVLLSKNVIFRMMYCHVELSPAQ